MKKVLVIAVSVIVVLVIVAVVGAMIALNPVAKRVVESSGSAATGVSTTVSAVNISILTGNVGVHELNIPNVEGYKTEHLMHTKSVHVEAKLASLLTDTLEVPTITIDGTHLNIEQKGIGQNNVSGLLDKMKANKSTQSAADSQGKKMRIGRIVLKDTTATVQTLPIPGKASTLEVKVPEIVLNDVTPDNAGSVATPEVIRRVLPAILAAVVQKGAGLIPDDLRNAIGGDVNQLVGQLGGEAQKMLGDATKNLGDLGKNLPDLGKVLAPGSGTNTGANPVSDVSKKAEEGLKNIFGGKK
jgi:hypothetical protein